MYDVWAVWLLYDAWDVWSYIPVVPPPRSQRSGPTHAHAHATLTQCSVRIIALLMLLGLFLPLTCAAALAVVHRRNLTRKARDLVARPDGADHLLVCGRLLGRRADPQPLRIGVVWQPDLAVDGWKATEHRRAASGLDVAEEGVAVAEVELKEAEHDLILADLLGGLLDAQLAEKQLFVVFVFNLLAHFWRHALYRF